MEFVISMTDTVKKYMQVTTSSNLTEEEKAKVEADLMSDLAKITDNYEEFLKGTKPFCIQKFFVYTGKNFLYIKVFVYISKKLQ